MTQYLNGRVGQVRGPFDSTDLLSPEGAITVFTPQSEFKQPVLIKLGIQADPGTMVKINNADIQIGSTGIYQLDNVVMVKSLIFTSGAGANTLVDFVY